MEKYLKDLHKKFPKLREDLVISKMTTKSGEHYVVKDPLKNSYFRFTAEEWDIIKYFDGEKEKEHMVEQFNRDHEFVEIDLETIDEYWNNLDSLNLLIKSKEDMNVMLVEKVKEMREVQLLSKKGSIMYKRFPLVDPDKFFDKIIPHIDFLWTKKFFVFSFSCMIVAVIIILSNWTKFNTGIYELFTFSEMSFSHLAILWVVIYLTIALHELGHGLTCKYYGGEVHEIGFLLLFFQPCLYANVNDAWLFDKKWKQIMVTIAGGYVEFFIGSIFTFVWFLTNPNTFLNVISFQIMTICSLSTVFFNFNPLIKLDGYYLLSDYLEVPNLKEESTSYIKYLSKKYIFRMPVEKNDSTNWEKKVYFSYGVATTVWMTLLLTGLVGMAGSLLIGKFNEFGVLMTAFIAYKIFGGHVKSSFKFLVSWFLQHHAKLKSSRMKLGSSIGFAVLLIIMFIPVSYTIRGKCTLEASSIKVLRAMSNVSVLRFFKNDGDFLKRGDHIVKLDNLNIRYEREIASLAVTKSKRKHRKNIVERSQKTFESRNELSSKQMELSLKEKELQGLTVKYDNVLSRFVSLSCPDQERIVGKFLKKGDEICRLYDVEKLKSLIEINEQDVTFLKKGQEVYFKLVSNPVKTFEGVVSSIRPTAKSDPKNPGRRIYTAEIVLINNGKLRPGMIGVAKILGTKVSLFKYAFTKISSGLRLDLFF